MDTTAQKDHFDVSIFLSVDDKTRHWTYFGQKRTASIHQSDFGGGIVTKETRIHNGRDKSLKLDEASFELVDCPTALTKDEFYALQDGDAPAVKKYQDEVAAFVKSKLGCDEVHCMHSQVRNAKKQGKNGVEGYAGGGPHTDSSTVSADEAALQIVGSNPEKYERYLYVNLWRNIADEPIENDHLAMLDERTTAKPDDYIVRDLFGPGYNVVQYGLNARHAAHHKWYYFPAMHRDEGILFKQFDSDFTKQGRVCFHMSANDPEVKQHRPRESIELRMMCFWKVADSGVNSMPTPENINAEMIKDPLQIAKEMSEATTFSPFKWLKGMFSKSSDTYSGNPEDYLDNFITKGIDSLPMWPSFGKTWAIQQLNSDPNDIEVGIKLITKGLVEDSYGSFNTKSLSKENKEEIFSFLIKNEKYMEAAKKGFGSLLEEK